MQQQDIEKQVIIIIQSGQVYLYNQLAVSIDTLIYETFAMLTTDDMIGISSSPKYKISNIPANTAVFLETLDRWEDGKIYYNLLTLTNSTINFEGKIMLKSKQLSGMIPLPQLTTVEKVKLSSTAGFTVNIEQKNIKNLYWIAEDLVAYTDLTGDRFDLETAQFKLWKMKSFMNDFDNSEIVDLYQRLDNLLEIPMFFDKETFTKLVYKLFNSLEKMK